mmetsp:Transcript_17161/g.54293  ORF Transcript_17161/g.54293 Transcript_17161/m.54293 type:complete len:348 (+) Transcript_17161:2076-3119(+)
MRSSRGHSRGNVFIPQGSYSRHLVQASPRGGGGCALVVGPHRRLLPHGGRAVGALRPPPAKLVVRPADPSVARGRLLPAERARRGGGGVRGRRGCDGQPSIATLVGPDGKPAARRRFRHARCGAQLGGDAVRPRPRGDRSLCHLAVSLPRACALDPPLRFRLPLHRLLQPRHGRPACGHRRGGHGLAQCELRACLKRGTARGAAALCNAADDVGLHGLRRSGRWRGARLAASRAGPTPRQGALLRPHGRHPSRRGRHPGGPERRPLLSRWAGVLRHAHGGHILASSPLSRLPQAVSVREADRPRSTGFLSRVLRLVPLAPTYVSYMRKSGSASTCFTFTTDRGVSKS